MSTLATLSKTLSTRQMSNSHILSLPDITHPIICPVSTILHCWIHLCWGTEQTHHTSIKATQHYLQYV